MWRLTEVSKLPSCGDVRRLVPERWLQQPRTMGFACNTASEFSKGQDLFKQTQRLARWTLQADSQGAIIQNRSFRTEMAPFDARHTVTLQAPLQPTWEQLSSEDAFIGFVKLSSLCHSIEILSTEQTSLSNAYLDEVLRDHETNVNRTRLNLPSPAPTEDTVPTTRFNWRLVERVPLLGGIMHNDVEIFGCQLVVPARHVHLYENSANGGLVKCLKIRRFEAAPGDTTKISELVRGETKWILKHWTERACREAHTEHMEAYHTLLPKTAAA